MLLMLRSLLSQMAPYYQLTRLSKPVGIYLLLWPCYWGLVYSGASLFNYILFAFGAVAMRSAGCVINDLADRDFDKDVERTKSRPLASGLVSIRQALFFLTVLLFLGFLVFLQLSFQAQIVSLLAVVLMVIYPFSKRFTHFPQLILGLAFNSGVVIAYAHVMETFDIPHQIWCLYGFGILWTISYDSIYAFQDVEDDKRVGVKSTAVRFEKSPKIFVGTCYALSIGFLWPYFDRFLIVFCPFLMVFLHFWNPKNKEKCLKYFKLNHWIGVIIICLLYIKKAFAV